MDLLNVLEELVNYFVLTSEKDNQWEIWLDELITYENGKFIFNNFNSISLVSTKNVLSYVDGDTCTLEARLYLDGQSVQLEGVPITFFDGATSLGTAITDSGGIATKTYTATGKGDMSITATSGSITSSVVYIEDIYWYSDDGTKLSGTYSTGSDSSYSYITNIGTNVEFPHIPTGDFELSMKVYRPTTTTGRALLIEFGASHSDTLLCGWDEGNSSTAKNCRIYRRSGSNNTSVQNITNPNYNNEEWIDFKLRFEDGTVTLTTGGTSISTTRSSITRIGNYSQTTSKLSEFKIKQLNGT